ncbi:MAG: hypothetical protein S4CHLAM6_04780 [Chlamydiae bacterium]|nr:hypothetical protein [Chlamydiota bacterium]
MSRVLPSPCSSPDSNPFLTPPEYFLDGVVRFVTLTGQETGELCQICQDPLGMVLKGRVSERVVSTCCECARVNTLYHSACLSHHFIVRRRDDDKTVCLTGRHELDPGELGSVVALFFGQSSGPFPIDAQRSQTDEPESDRAQRGSGSPNEKLESKVSDVVSMTSTFGQGRRWDHGKRRELLQMAQETGQPRRPGEMRNWKRDRYNDLMSSLGDSSSSSEIDVDWSRAVEGLSGSEESDCEMLPYEPSKELTREEVSKLVRRVFRKKKTKKTY